MASDFTHFDTKMPSDVGALMDLGHLQDFTGYTCNVSFSVGACRCSRGEGVAVSWILRPFAKDMSLSEVPNHKEISTQYHQQFLSIYGQLRHTKP